ncbi:hypothetical protein KVR01_009219 [Diaporthe batatas]|uniref:uncharacterized protein n=1 Tax=Diaporthe batatas TaxID=748121 RepID=UPI001D0535DD|nr:uncharacterized protein KVR01_009219 [Diaporthe batatas]KAG8160955.1 hypothetical protein KVR01_009219 [Diaporthe batatas]
MFADLSRKYEHVQFMRKYPDDVQEPAVFSAEIGIWRSNVKGCGYKLGPKGLRREGPFFPYAVDVSSWNGGPGGSNPVYIPMHRDCFHIALRSPRWDRTRATALRGLFRVLRHRFQVALEQRPMNFPGIYDNDQIVWDQSRWNLPYSSINTSGFQNTEGVERGYFSTEWLHRQFWEECDCPMMYDPLNIPSLTETLLKNLKRCGFHRVSKETRLLRKHIGNLPNELKLMIYELLRTDLDLRMDWEWLFRELLQGPKLAECGTVRPESDYETFKGILDHVPLGLEGRRRVWKLPEKVEIVQHIPEVPVYWGPDGEPLGEAELGAL